MISNRNSYNTIGVVGNYLDGSTDRSYHIFEYPARIISELYAVSNLELSSREAFEYMAFMNYFQRPAFEYGKSIDINEIDTKVAYNNLIQVVDIIQPDIIIFLSKLAYNNFKESDLNDIKCYKIPHPCCAWWNRKTKVGYNGPKYLTEILKENI